MKAVLESGPWMINNVPLVLNVWEPGIWLEKVEPSTIPIWVCVYGIPLELCNGNGIGKIMSGVGKPMLVDKLTRERCLKKAVISDRPGRIGKLEVKYQWKPPQCSHCKTFSHSTSACKVRPRSEEEIAAGIIKDVLNVNKSMCGKENSEKMDSDGFVEVRKKNKHVSGHNFGKQNGYQNRYNFFSCQSRRFQTYNRFNGSSGRTNFARRGPNQLDRNGSGGGRNQSNGWKVKGIDKSIGLNKGNVNVMSDAVSSKKSLNQHDVKFGNVLKPSLMYKFSIDFQLKVLIRGSRSCLQVDVKGENVPLSNSFQALDDQDMMDKEECFLSSADEEFKSAVWPKLQKEVEDVMKYGVYPSKSVRSNWSLSQLDFFYNNCSKFGLAPYVDDDDVESKNDGMAMEMKSCLNNDLNQNQAIDMIRNGSYSICALLETKLKKNKLSRICSKVMGRWDWISNASSFVAINGNQKFFYSFVYGYYKEASRKSLWKELSLHSLMVKDAPWVLLGDFNVILEPSERSFGYYGISAGMEEFRSCIAKIEVSDLVMSELRFTWNKSPNSPNGLLKKLDRVMCNMGFLDKFPNANAVFLPFECSDHSLSVLNIPSIAGPKPKPFKFANFLAFKAEFSPIVKSVWEKGVLGFVMFSLVSKLKLLKNPLRKLKSVQGDLAEKVQSLKVEVLKGFFAAAKDEELLLKQRSKISWFSEGDFNTKYFHNAMKEKRNKGRIEYMEDLDGNSFFGDSVRDQFLKNIESVLGKKKEVVPIHEPSSLFINKLSMMDADLMVKPVSLKEIKDVLFNMNDDKAPGPDGFSAKFFKGAWSIVGAKFSQAILDFFSNGKLLKEINPTIIALVPKSQTPKRVYDFRPVSCCNIVYKCISKIIANRIKGSLNSLVDDCQTFIPSRQISDNILLSQELMRNYHRKSGPSKVSFKIDIQKAYDSVDWGFLNQCLIHFGFPWKIINWIMNCMTSPSYTICVNGDHCGYFYWVETHQTG
nr:hypothetical protein [Tanacetum cinerariifolium]